MADSLTGVIHWYAPDPRAILPLHRFRIPRSLRSVLRRERFEVAADRSFGAVIRACAESAPGRMKTWISEELIPAYDALHLQGHAHSVETYLDGTLVGGLYGVALGGAFFGESMFHRETDASKVALVVLVDHLINCGFELLDIQWKTDHLARFGAEEVPRETYERLLARALRARATWMPLRR